MTYWEVLVKPSPKSQLTETASSSTSSRMTLHSVLTKVWVVTVSGTLSNSPKLLLDCTVILGGWFLYTTRIVTDVSLVK